MTPARQRVNLATVRDVGLCDQTPPRTQQLAMRSERSEVNLLDSRSRKDGPRTPTCSRGGVRTLPGATSLKIDCAKSQGSSTFKVQNSRGHLSDLEMEGAVDVRMLAEATSVLQRMMSQKAASDSHAAGARSGPKVNPPQSLEGPHSTTSKISDVSSIVSYARGAAHDQEKHICDNIGTDNSGPQEYNIDCNSEKDSAFTNENSICKKGDKSSLVHTLERLVQENESLKAAFLDANKRLSRLEDEKHRFFDEGIFDLVNSVCDRKPADECAPRVRSNPDTPGNSSIESVEAPASPWGHFGVLEHECAWLNERLARSMDTGAAGAEAEEERAWLVDRLARCLATRRDGAATPEKVMKDHEIATANTNAAPISKTTGEKGIKNVSLQEKKIGEKSLERGKTRAGERQSSAGQARRCRPASQKVCPSVSCGTPGPTGQRRSRTPSGGLPSSTVFTTAMGATDAEDANSEPTQLSPDLNVTSTTALCLFDSQALETTSVWEAFLLP